MKLNFCCFFLFLFFGIAQAQQLNCTVNVNSDKVTITNKQIFNTLEKSLSDFINKTDWTGVIYKQEEKINCSMFITVTAYDSNQFTATIQVQSSRPIYNSTYTSPILNFNDKDFSF
jgi:Flp pilus assembly protein TadG